MIPEKEQIAYDFLLAWQGVPKCDLHWFDEKPIYSNSVPHSTYGEVGVDAQVQKKKSTEVHYSQLTLCNTIYGFLNLKVIKHEPSKSFLWSHHIVVVRSVTLRNTHLLEQTDKGTDRNTFIEQCKEEILPILKESYECRGNKVQYLFIDQASIHNDNGWEEVKGCFKPYAEVHYLPSVAHELLTPLDFSLFRQQQHYYSLLPNSTEKEVRDAVQASSNKITVKHVSDAVREIGYSVNRRAVY
jgi:hypothetical protein